MSGLFVSYLRFVRSRMRIMHLSMNRPSPPLRTGQVGNIRGFDIVYTRTRINLSNPLISPPGGGGGEGGLIGG